MKFGDFRRLVSVPDLLPLSWLKDWTCELTDVVQRPLSPHSSPSHYRTVKRPFFERCLQDCSRAAGVVRMLENTVTLGRGLANATRVILRGITLIIVELSL